MARLAVFAVVVSSSGCAQIFGLDETSRAIASLEIQRISIGAALSTAPQDLTGLSADYLVANTAVPGFVRTGAVQSTTGTWALPVDEPTPLLFGLTEGPLQLYDFPNFHVKTVHAVFEHPDREPPPPGAMLTVDVALDAPYTAGEQLQLFTVGAWGSYDLTPHVPAMSMTATASIAYTAVTSETDRPLDRITAADGIVVLRYNAATNPRHLVAALDAASFEQTGNDTITGSLTPVAREPLAVPIDAQAVVDRFARVTPPVASPFLGWHIEASPGAPLAVDKGPRLASGVVTPPETAISTMFGNPFAQRRWEAILAFDAFAARSFTPKGGLPVQLIAGQRERVRPVSGTVLTLPAGLPTEVRLDGTPLTTDGLAITMPLDLVDIEFSLDVESNTLYEAQLFKLGTDGTMTLTVLALGVEPRFQLPPEAFEAGAYYSVLAIATKGSFPAVADGDLTKRELPLAQSFAHSGVFQIMP